MEQKKYLIQVGQHDSRWNVTHGFSPRGLGIMIFIFSNKNFNALNYHVRLNFWGGCILYIFVRLPWGAAAIPKHCLRRVTKSSTHWKCSSFFYYSCHKHQLFFFFGLRTSCFSLLSQVRRLIWVWPSPPCSFNTWRSRAASGYHSNFDWLTIRYEISQIYESRPQKKKS